MHCRRHIYTHTRRGRERERDRAQMSRARKVRYRKWVRHCRCVSIFSVCFPHVLYICRVRLVSFYVRQQKITLGLYGMFPPYASCTLFLAIFRFLYHFNHNRCQLRRKVCRAQMYANIIPKRNNNSHNNTHGKNQQTMLITTTIERRGEKIEPREFE